MPSQEVLSLSPEVEISQRIVELEQDGFCFEAAMEPGEAGQNRWLSQVPFYGAPEIHHIVKGFDNKNQQALEDLAQQLAAEKLEPHDVVYIIDCGLPSRVQSDQIPPSVWVNNRGHLAYKPGAVTFFTRPFYFAAINKPKL